MKVAENNAQSLPKGYKQTEVGIIPMDWDVNSIKGITTDMLQGVNTAIDIPEYVESGYPILKANNIIEGEVNFSTSDHISIKTYQGYSDRFKIKKNDFLFSNIGARLGTGSLMKTNTECSFAWNVMRIIPNQRIVKPEFLGCIMNSPALFKEIKKNESGSGMGFVPKNVLQTLTFPIPKNLEEQTAIATALSDADALISSLEKLLTKKRNIKQGAMQKLLQPKEGWEVKKLGEICEFSSGTAHENFIDETGDYVVVNSKFISTNGEVRKYANSVFCPVKIGDILIVLSDVPNGKAIAKCFLVDKDNFYTVNQRIGIIKPLQNISSEFLHFLINRHPYLLAFDDGAKQTNLRNQDVTGLPVCIPKSKEEQTRIATILSDMDAEISALETKLEKYKKVKLGMMQELLTGKIRLV